jgi:hypothetical protein
MVQRLKPSSSKQVSMRALAGAGAKRKRRRARHRGFSAKNKKRNRKLASRAAQPAKILPKPATPAPAPGWKSVLTTLGILSLLGASQLNRGDNGIGAGENNPFNPHRDDATDVDPSRTPLSLDLNQAREWRADGRVHNFVVNEAPAVDAALAPPSVTNDGLGHSPLLRGEEMVLDELDRDSDLLVTAPAISALRLPRPMVLPNLITPASPWETMPLVITPAMPSWRRSGLRWERLALVETGSLGLAALGFRKFDEFFGGAKKPFRWRNDWTKDHTLHFDELIHFQGGYRIAQGMIGLYRWAGLNKTWAEGLGAGTAASVMTFLEYIDGRRPKKQGASFTDFTANLLGVSFALAKLHVDALQNFDLRLNYTAFGDVLHKKTLLKYDRMTHWLTYDLQRPWRVPLHVGLGYGVRNAFKPNVRSELYFGAGFTPVNILKRYSPEAAKSLAWLNMYHLGWQVQIK